MVEREDGFQVPCTHANIRGAKYGWTTKAISGLLIGCEVGEKAILWVGALVRPASQTQVGRGRGRRRSRRDIQIHARRRPPEEEFDDVGRCRG